MLESRCHRLWHRDFLSLNLWAFRSVRFSDTKQRKAVAAANDVSLACVESVRQPSAI